MNEEQIRQDNLIDTTDCLEAVGVFRGWKNFLFIVVILCLLLLQTFFLLVATGHVKICCGQAECAETCSVKTDDVPDLAPAAVVDEVKKTDEPAAQINDQIQKAAAQITAEPNTPTEAESEKLQIKLSFNVTFKQLSWLIRFFDFVLIPAAILYCLTMLFILKVSMLGRLGGINHICRAFFLSLLFVVLLLPWQKFFGSVVAGAMYTPAELSNACVAAKDGGIFCTIFLYLRFSGYWLLVLLLLIFAQFRSSRWAGAMLRRLEVI